MGLHFCLNDAEEIFDREFLLGFVLILTLLYIIMITIWLRNRKNFPIKERSPWLTFFAAVCALLSTLVHPLSFIYLSYSNELANLYDSEDDPEFLSFLSSLYKSLKELFVWPFIFRTLRLIYVFNINFPIRTQFLDKLFSRESYLILGCLVIFWLTFFISFFDPDKTDENNFACNLKNTSNFLIFYNMFHYFIYITLAFCLRNITKEYNFQTEMMYFTVSCILIDNFFILCEYYMEIIDKSCVGPLPLQHFILYMKNFFLVGIIMMYPVRFSSRVHFPLPPSIATEDWKFLLVDERFFLVFYSYLEQTQRQYEELISLFNVKKNINIRKKYATIYLRFYMDVSIASKRGRQESIELIIENYLNSGDQTQAFPQCLLDHILKRENISSEATTSNPGMYINDESLYFDSDLENKSTKNIPQTRPRTISEFGEIYVFSELQLKELFNDFSKTYSFQKIRHIIKNYDLLNARLFQYNLIRCD